MYQKALSILRNLRSTSAAPPNCKPAAVQIPLHAENWSGRINSPDYQKGVLVIAIPDPRSALLAIELQATKAAEYVSVSLCFIPRPPLHGEELVSQVKKLGVELSGGFGAPLGDRERFICSHSPTGRFGCGPGADLEASPRCISRFISAFARARSLVADDRVREAVVSILEQCLRAQASASTSVPLSGLPSGAVPLPAIDSLRR